MKNQFNLQIKKPCHQNFNTFSKTSSGGFCGSCKKEVIDFTIMTSSEIATYFETKQTQNTCGRFESHQLKTYTTYSRNRFHLFTGIAVALLSVFSFGKVKAQNIKNVTDSLTQKSIEVVNPKNKKVKGFVRENNSPLPGVNIILEGTTIGTSSDIEGYFEFPEKLKSGDVLIFSYIGSDSKKVVITDKNDSLNISLNINLSMSSCVLMGDVAIRKPYSSKNK